MGRQQYRKVLSLLPLAVVILIFFQAMERGYTEGIPTTSPCSKDVDIAPA
jgi:hypothetical protein